MTLPAVATDLPPHWAAFADAVAGGQTPEEAAKALNLPGDPKRTAAALMRHPSVRQALTEASNAELMSSGLHLAWGVVREILSDRCPKAKAVRAKLAIAVIDRAQPPKEKALHSGDKPIGEMTMAELEQYVRDQRSSVPPGPDMRNITPGR